MTLAVVYLYSIPNYVSILSQLGLVLTSALENECLSTRSLLIFLLDSTSLPNEDGSEKKQKY